MSSEHENNKHIDNTVDEEQLLRLLAEAADDPPDGDAQDPAVSRLRSELDALGAELRHPRPEQRYEDEEQCLKAGEAVRDLDTASFATGERGPDASGGERTGITELGQYRVQSLLGRGGMGTVYKALHTKLKKLVALKVLPADRLQDAESVQRFEREMEAVGQLDHPNIVRAMDAGEINGTHYLVMELLEGVDLSTLVRGTGPLRVADSCELIRQAASGLQEAYERGMVHRDVKPSNLMLTRVRGGKSAPQVKLLDLGLASLGDVRNDDGEITGSGQVMGTMDYMAPEQGMDSRNVDIRADIYALGATLYRLLTGHVTFPASRYDSLMKKMMAISSQPPTPVRELRVEVPEALAAVVDRMLAKDPGQRPATPRDVCDELDPFCVDTDLASLLRTWSPPDRPNVSAPGQTIETQPVSAASGSTDTTYLLEKTPRQPTDHADVHRPSRQLRSVMACVGLTALMTLVMAFVWRPWDRDADLDPVEQNQERPNERLPSATVHHLLPPVAASTKRSKGRFVDSGQTLGQFSSMNLDAGDVDGDGDIDVLVANSGHSDEVRTELSRLYLNDGRGHFSVGQQLPSAWAYDVKLGDLDGDDDLDAVFANRLKRSSSSIWLNDGSGSFVLDGQLRTDEAYSVTLCDIEGDFDLDIIVGGESSIRCFRNENGSFIPIQDFGSRSVRHMAMADVDGDGDPDLVATVHKFPDEVWLNDGKGRFVAGQQLPTPGPGGHVALADVDHDGDFDAVISKPGVGPTNRLWLNDGAGGFQQGELPSTNVYSVGVAVADLNGDGRRDIFLGGGGTLKDPRGGPNEILIATPDGTGWTVSEMGSLETTDVALEDLDGDGDLDAFLTKASKLPNRVWFNQDQEEPDPPRMTEPGDVETSAEKQPAANNPSPTEILTSDEFRWSTPVRLGTAVNTSADECGPTVTADGRTLVFYRIDKTANVSDLWISQRESTAVPFGEPVRMHDQISSPLPELEPSLTGDGLVLVFRRTEGRNANIWMATRPSADVPFGAAERLGPNINTGVRECNPSISSNGKLLIVSAGRSENYGGTDHWLLSRDARSDPFTGPPVNAGPNINTAKWDESACIAPDHRSLVFTVWQDGEHESSHDLWISTRPDADQPFGVARPLGDVLTTPWDEMRPFISADGRHLYFDSDRGDGSRELWKVERVRQDESSESDETSAGLASEFTRELLPRIPKPTKSSAGRFYDSGQRLGSTGASQVHLGDLDGDGDLDAILAIGSGDQGNQVWFNGRRDPQH